MRKKEKPRRGRGQKTFNESDNNPTSGAVCVQTAADSENGGNEQNSADDFETSHSVFSLVRRATYPVGTSRPLSLWS